VVALCEKDEVSARKFLRELGRKVEVYRDYRELLEHGLDVVVLTGYYPDHAPQAVEALKRGINVLSEVCACHTLAQGVELCRVAEEAQQKGVHYMLAENCCYFNTVQEMETGRWDGDGRKIESLLKVHRQKVMEEASVEVYEPPFRRFAEEASGAGHGGGDLFVVWEFMEALAHNRRPPIDVYMAMDMTLPGILAYRSALMGGVPLEVPDFRREDVRRLYEADTWDPDPRKAGPGDPPPSVLGKVEISEDVKALLEEKTRRYREESDG